MNKQIINLEIIDELEESGVNAISLVDMPAIQVGWLAFKRQNFVEPREGESEEEFLPRCMSKLVGEEGYEQDQAAAICYSTYREKMEIDTSELPPYVDQIPKKRVNLENNLKVDDEVSWTTAGSNPRGRIREIIESGSKKIPGADFEISGTPEDPAYIIEIYKETDGKWEPTGEFVGRKRSSILKNVKLLFADQDKQILIGPALIPDQEIYRIDDDYEYYVKFSQDVIARIAEKFMRELRARETNIQHNSENPAESYVMETWLIETEEDKANTKYGFDLPIGTWMLKVRVTDPEVWTKVKNKELNGFSIEGNFVSEEEADMLRDKSLLAKIIEILNS